MIEVWFEGAVGILWHLDLGPRCSEPLEDALAATLVQRILAQLRLERAAVDVELVPHLLPLLLALAPHVRAALLEQVELRAILQLLQALLDLGLVRELRDVAHELLAVRLVLLVQHALAHVRLLVEALPVVRVEFVEDLAVAALALVQRLGGMLLLLQHGQVLLLDLEVVLQFGEDVQVALAHQLARALGDHGRAHALHALLALVALALERLLAAPVGLAQALVETLVEVVAGVLEDAQRGGVDLGRSAARAGLQRGVERGHGSVEFLGVECGVELDERLVFAVDLEVGEAHVADRLLVLELRARLDLEPRVARQALAHLLVQRELELLDGVLPARVEHSNLVAERDLHFDHFPRTLR